MRRGEYDDFDDVQLRDAFARFGNLLRAEITLDKVQPYPLNHNLQPSPPTLTFNPHPQTPTSNPTSNLRKYLTLTSHPNLQP